MSRNPDGARHEDCGDEPDAIDLDEPEHVDPFAPDESPCCEHGTCGREDCPNTDEPRDTIKTPPLCSVCGKVIELDPTCDNSEGPLYCETCHDKVYP